MESAEQLPEVAGASGERAEPSRKLESRANLRRTCNQRVKGGSACLDAQRFTPQDLKNRGKGTLPLTLFTQIMFKNVIDLMCRSD